MTDTYVAPSVRDTDGLASVLGVMPDAAEEMLGRVRTPSGTWRRRSLRETSDLIQSLQLVLLRGALSVWKARCRAADRWWLSPAAETAVRARVAQCGQARHRDSSRLTRRAEERRAAAYELRMAKKAARREARVAAMGCQPPPLRGRTKRLKRRLPGEPHPVDRPARGLAAVEGGHALASGWPGWTVRGPRPGAGTGVVHGPGSGGYGCSESPASGGPWT